MLRLTLFLLLWCYGFSASAHHFNPDNPTYLTATQDRPDGIRVQAHAGELSLRMVTYPAHPEANQPIRVELQVWNPTTKAPYEGAIELSIETQRTPFSDSLPLATKRGAEGQFSHQFKLQQDGFYLLTAEFEYHDEPYRIDLPLRSGTPFPLWPVIFTVGFVVLVLGGVALIKRRRPLQS